MNNLSIVSDMYSKKTWKGSRKRATYICICWNTQDFPVSKVKSWEVKSCWCLHRKYWHWLTNTKIYRVYNSMVDRCDNSNNTKYYRYWWRWIKCLRNTFEDFYKDMWTSYKEWLTIDRTDNNWDYCKENCRWITRKENSLNKENTVMYKWEPLSLYCESNNISYTKIRWRLFRYKLWRTESDIEYCLDDSNFK